MYDRIHQLLVKGAVVEGFGLRERWRRMNSGWKKIGFKHVVKQMRWVKRNGTFHGAFEWVRDRRGQEWIDGWNEKLHEFPSSLHPTAAKCGRFHIVPQEILLEMVQDVAFVSSWIIFLRSS